MTDLSLLYIIEPKLSASAARTADMRPGVRLASSPIRARAKDLAATE
jgi:hypothetical protein